MAAEEADVLVVGGSARSDRRGALRYVADSYVQFFEECAVIPLDGPVGYFAHDSGRARCVEELPAVEYADFMTRPGSCGKVAEYVKKFHPKRVAFYGVHTLSAEFHLSLAERLEDLRMIDFTESLDGIRSVKSDEEIALSQHAVCLNEDVFRVYLKGIEEGSGILDAIAEASSFAMKNGCEDQYWLLGSQGAAPRSLPMAPKKDLLRTDEGGSHVIVLEHTSPGGYFGEVMHSVFLGEPPDEAVAAFQAISRAQMLAGGAMQPGATVGSIADLIDEFLIYEGFLRKEDAGKASGHGQGLDIAEPPVVISGDPAVIQPGMRLNLHPSITLSTGIHVVSTDCYVIEKNGSRRLSALPYTPLVL